MPSRSISPTALPKNLRGTVEAAVAFCPSPTKPRLSTSNASPASSMSGTSSSCRLTPQCSTVSSLAALENLQGLAAVHRRQRIGQVGDRQIRARFSSPPIVNCGLVGRETELALDVRRDQRAGLGRRGTVEWTVPRERVALVSPLKRIAPLLIAFEDHAGQAAALIVLLLALLALDLGEPMRLALSLLGSKIAWPMSRRGDRLKISLRAWQAKLHQNTPGDGAA